MPREARLTTPAHIRSQILAEFRAAPRAGQACIPAIGAQFGLPDVAVEAVLRDALAQQRRKVSRTRK